MKKTKLTLKEIQSLNVELNGSITGKIPGFLSSNLPIKTKYWVSKLATIVSSESSTITDNINELIKKYGTPMKENAQRFEVKEFIENGEPNEAYTKFYEEVNELLSQEIEVEHQSFTLDMFEGISSNLRLDIFFKLIS